jgi:uncharacterized membrane protein
MQTNLNLMSNGKLYLVKMFMLFKKELWKYMFAVYFVWQNADW